jgi:hypothetical protein
LAVENGVSAHAVAASLGHESSRTTMLREAGGGKQRRVMTVPKGGRLNPDFETIDPNIVPNRRTEKNPQ